MSSSVPPIRERIVGNRSSVMLTAEPQMGQKWRHKRCWPSTVASYVATGPSRVTASLGKITPIRNAESDYRWQRSHWHSPTLRGSPSYRYRTAPHRQPPVPPAFVSVMVSPPLPPALAATESYLHLLLGARRAGGAKCGSFIVLSHSFLTRPGFSHKGS